MSIKTKRILTVTLFIVFIISTLALIIMGRLGTSNITDDSNNRVESYQSTEAESESVRETETYEVETETIETQVTENEYKYDKLGLFNNALVQPYELKYYNDAVDNYTIIDYREEDYVDYKEGIELYNPFSEVNSANDVMLESIYGKAGDAADFADFLIECGMPTPFTIEMVDRKEHTIMTVDSIGNRYFFNFDGTQKYSNRIDVWNTQGIIIDYDENYIVESTEVNDDEMFIEDNGEYDYTHVMEWLMRQLYPDAGEYVSYLDFLSYNEQSVTYYDSRSSKTYRVIVDNNKQPISYEVVN